MRTATRGALGAAVVLLLAAAAATTAAAAAYLVRPGRVGNVLVGETFAVPLTPERSPSASVTVRATSTNSGIVLLLNTTVVLPANSTAAVALWARAVGAGSPTLHFAPSSADAAFNASRIPDLDIVVLRSHTLDILAAVVGWLYFAAWSISFYPQIYLNWRRKRCRRVRRCASRAQARPALTSRPGPARRANDRQRGGLELRLRCL